jgi:ABC-type multidrug transport system fused ATPase/permease subunit
VRNSIEFESVNFAYASGPDVLHSLSFRLPAQRTSVIVGPSGSGKSTILSLLQRVHEYRAGRITIDGAELHEFEIGSWRQRLSTVTQDLWLMNRSLKENLEFGCQQSPSRNEIEEVLKGLGLGKLLDHLELPIGPNGNQLSLGMRQRVAIARAVLRPADLYIFDEATNSLDAETERKVWKWVGRRLQGKTVVVVTHRLSAIERVDHLLELEQGRIRKQAA